MIVDFGYKSNLANEALRVSRRNKFYHALIETVRKVPIYAPGGGFPSLGEIGKPSYTVAISEEESARQKEKADRDREAKRMAVPPVAVDTGVSSGVDIRPA